MTHLYWGNYEPDVSGMHLTQNPNAQCSGYLSATSVELAFELAGHYCRLYERSGPLHLLLRPHYSYGRARSP